MVSAEGNLISYGTVEFKAKLCWIWKLYVDQSNIDTELSEIREAMPRNQLLRVKRKKEATERPHLSVLGISRGGKIAVKAGAWVFTFIASFLSLRYSYIDKTVLNTNLNIFYYLTSTHALECFLFFLCCR